MINFKLTNSVKEIAIISDGDDMFKTAKVYKLRVNDVKITIPEGFGTNLASIPRVFWFVFPPFGKYTTPSIVHDYFYTTNKLPREDADLLYLLMMKEFGVNVFVRNWFYIIVRLFGGSHYKSNS